MVRVTSQGWWACSNLILCQHCWPPEKQHLSLTFLFQKPQRQRQWRGSLGQIVVQGEKLALERKSLSGMWWGRRTREPGPLAANTGPIAFPSHPADESSERSSN